ncbi:hypothetical protein PFISCL1PPCAC_6949, partial [Pristionchus fissidentatus]
FTCTHRCTPELEQREILALLLVAGEQFDDVKIDILGKKAKESTIYSAIGLLEQFVISADFAPPSTWPLVIQLAKDNAHRIRSIIESIGEDRLELYS